MLEELKIDMADVFQRCQDRLNSFNRRKKAYQFLRRTELFFSTSCSSLNYSAPCLTFLWLDCDGNDLDKTTIFLADMICPVLLDTIIQGDPRISSANIIWVTPDTNTWVRNPSKSSNGELALDIILEKAAVKQSGDAWRIVLDSCLPVLHLIDTRRSIPYAIKQIQELLGISCTFDQAIQRLAASVKMVAKGVLREHLLLLGSSMTCGGNLVGFNTGGYKALARQLNIQVPFTDATLFTPRKCFERAAEKCHADSLSSIVASCSWGKHVAVGTGSRFDVVWNSKEITSNDIEGMDVYNFLHMVKGLNNGEEENNACLGEDIDDLLDEENVDWGMSPQHASEFDAVFEENFELLNGSTSNGWDANSDQTKTNSNEWSAWGKNKSEIQVDVAARDQGDTEQNNDWSDWRKNKDEIQDGDQTKRNSNDWSSWKKNKSEILVDVAVRDQGDTDQNNDRSDWGRNKDEIQDGRPEQAHDNSWRAQKRKTDVTPEDSSKPSAWNANKDTTKPKSNDWSSWGKNKDVIQDGGSKRAQEDSWSSQKWTADVIQEDSSKSWGSNQDATKPKSNDWSSWGKNKDDIRDGGSKRDDSWSYQKLKADVTQEDSSMPSAWGAKKDTTKPESNDWSPWGKSKNDIQDGGSKRAQEDSWSSQKWTADVTQEDSSKSRWGANKDATKPKANDWSTWGKNTDDIQDGGSSRPQEDSWSSGKWKAESNVGADVMQDAWQHNSDNVKVNWEAKMSVDNCSWGKPKSPENKARDSQNESNQAASSRGWDSQIVSANSDGDRNYQWGKQGRESFKKNRYEGSQGWGSNAGDRRNNNRPPRAPGQRLDIYSSEEQDVLKDIEPIMQSIRRIMQQQGYNDGDPLAADDQHFVLENVFEHHPDKETKMGAGVDHVMVSRHSNFQESRCFYVVLKDGKREDFSYRKCLDNLIRKKYPDIADSFIGKYFWKLRGRRDQNQTQNPAGDQTTTPTGDQTTAPVPVETNVPMETNE